MSFRKALYRTTAVACIVAFAASCGGGSNSSSDESANGGDSASISMDDLVAAIETIDYTCSPESFVLTSAERQVCLTTSSVTLSPFVWENAEAFQNEVDVEIACTADSGLGELRSLQGESWAISSYSISGATADYDEEINSALTSLQQELGGEIISTPCA